MLDFGWAELLILVAVAVFVIGPKDIPNVMYGLGRIVRRIQYVRFAISQQFDDIMNTGDMEELRKGINFEEKREKNNTDASPEEEYDESAYDDAEELDIDAYNKQRMTELEQNEEAKEAIQTKEGIDDKSSK